MTATQPPAIVWFRHDLRLADNPAFAAAARTGPIILVFIWSPDEEGVWPLGAASRWWLHHSLAALDRALQKLKLRLVIRRGPAAETLAALARETASHAVFANRRYEPAPREQERRVADRLAGEHIVFQTFNASLLIEPNQIVTGKGEPYKVFTPFWKAARQIHSGEPDLHPTRPRPPRQHPASLALNDLNLLPRSDWAEGLRQAWTPGEAGAWQFMNQFVETGAAAYHINRDLPATQGTSRLSPHLHFGEISPRAILAALTHAAPGEGTSAAIRQLYWREFAHHLLYHFPRTPDQPLRLEFIKFPWRRSAKDLRAWQQGQTGFPIVDAAMRELWRTGWMHNRARMIAASFLVKDLLLPWQSGARWFWDTLVDADLANNTLGWQWIAGCGADAAPYFRVFNPTLQADKFDPDQTYIQRWVSELFDAPPDYPKPVVDHNQARNRALKAYATLKKQVE